MLGPYNSEPSAVILFLWTTCSPVYIRPGDTAVWGQTPNGALHDVIIGFTDCDPCIGAKELQSDHCCSGYTRIPRGMKKKRIHGYITQLNTFTCTSKLTLRTICYIKKKLGLSHIFLKQCTINIVIMFILYF